MRTKAWATGETHLPLADLRVRLLCKVCQIFTVAHCDGKGFFVGGPLSAEDFLKTS